MIQAREELIAERPVPPEPAPVYIPGISDRRTHRRYSYQSIVECIPLSLKSQGDAAFTAMTHDVSASGLSLQVMRNLSPGEHIKIHMGHPNSENSLFEVMWVVKGRPDEGFHVGLNLSGKA